MTHPPNASAHTNAEGTPLDARQHLLHTALCMFAQQGFQATSTRQICQAAKVNLSAIKYYFADKAGLYRAVLLHAFAQMTAGFQLDQADLSLDEFLTALYQPILPQHAQHGQCGDPQRAALDFDSMLMRLYLFEMIQPSHIFPDILQQTVQPIHQLACAHLCRLCGAAAVDNDIHQLAFALTAIAHDYCMSGQLMQQFNPSLWAGAHPRTHILQRLLGYGRALIEHEQRRRLAASC